MPVSSLARWFDYLIRLPKQAEGQDTSRIASAIRWIVTTNFLTKLGDELASPKVTLTWLLQSSGASAVAIGLLVPVRESGSMLPQIWLADPVARTRHLRRVHQFGTALQGLAILSMVGVVLTLEGAAVGWCVVALLSVFSLARCLCSLVSKAVLGRLVPKQMRGQTTGWSASAAGLAVSLAGVLIMVLLGAGKNQAVVIGLLVVAGLGWIVATFTYGRLPEPGHDENAKPQSEGLLARLRVLQRAPDFRRFVVARALLMSSALVAPYYILLASENAASIRALGTLLLASGVASLSSAPFWGRFADFSSRQVMMTAGTLVTALGVSTIVLARLTPELLASAWLLPLLYLALQIAHNGVRVGRKTYIVDLADDGNRVDFVSISNTLIGLLLLVIGIAGGLLAALLPTLAIIALYSAMSLGGVLLSLSLPEVE